MPNQRPGDQQADEAKARLATIVESSDDAIVSQTLDGVITSWNDGARRMFGYTADEVIGRPIALLIPPDRAGEDLPLLGRLRAGKQVNPFETVRTAKGGRAVEVSVSISPIRDAQGRVVGASKIARDLTARKRAEVLALDNEARLRAVLDGAVDGIITIDERGTIESVNPAVVTTFGYAIGEMVGRNVKMLMPDPYASGHDGYLANYRTTGVRKIIGIGREVVGRRKDGSAFPVDLSVSEVRLGDRRIFTGIVRDITARKRAETELRAARDAAEASREAAEAANRAKDHFLSVLSHELRAPLSPVLATVDLLQADAAARSPDELAGHLDVIRRNVQTQARLVDDLLDVTRISRGKVRLHFEVVDAHAAARTVVSMLQPEIDAKRLSVTLALRAADHHVWADPGRFQQVLLNLLSNAVKFTPEEGSISVRTGNADGPAAAADPAAGPGRRLRVEVVDDGVGIGPDVLPRLFRPFEQGERTVTRKFGGLGLGLSIVRSLVELHGGDVRATSDGPGRGTTVALTLETVAQPARELPAARAGAAAVPPAAAGPRFRVLLVEDHDDTRRVMTRLLGSLGCDVTAAASVGEAVAVADGPPFDLLLSDIGLPDGTGHDVIRQVRDRHTTRGATIRGIALSGFGLEEDVRRSREAGFEQHLVKPVNVEALREVIFRRAG